MMFTQVLFDDFESMLLQKLDDYTRINDQTQTQKKLKTNIGT